MAFSPIDSNTIKVGDPITSDTITLIKTNFDDHEYRLGIVETALGSVFVYNGDIDLAGFKPLNPDVFYYKARQDFSVNDFRIQLFTKQGLTSGDLTLDLQKSNDTNDANFTSILTSPKTISFASSPDYSQHVATINSGVNNIVANQVLRIKITNVPSGFTGKILVSIGAQ